jgi:hypothetical protein
LVEINPWQCLVGKQKLAVSRGLLDGNFGVKYKVMSSKPPQTAPDRSAGQRPPIVLAAVILGLLLVGGAVAYKLFQHSPPAAAPAEIAPAQTAPAQQPTVPRQEITAPMAAPVTPAPESAKKTPPASIPPPTPNVDARQLVTSLAALDLSQPISAEDAKKWKEGLQQLIRQGPSSVAAIREFLAQNLDMNYAGVSGGDQLGYSSLRTGLLNALGQIGGPESTAAMLETLQTTIFPTDLATLSTALEQQSPGQYQGDILAAVRAQLAAAAQDQLGNANVGPLFQLLSSAASRGVDVSADLAQYSSKWPYYSAIDLAGLPNSAGVPSLIQMAQNSAGGNQTAAVQALAQLAPQNSAALNALIDMAKQGQLSDFMVGQIAPYLGGRQNLVGDVGNLPAGTGVQGIHIASGNQDFGAYDFGNSIPPSQISERISIIDQFLQAIPTGDTPGQQALLQQKISLSAWQPK